MVAGLATSAEKLGLKAQKRGRRTNIRSYGFGPGCYFVLPILGPTTARDSIGMVVDFIDPFAHITWRENELLEYRVP